MIRKKEQQPQTFTISNPRSPMSEAFRTLRTNIYYAGVDKKIKKILITGANPACGKTTIAVNLGIAIAQTGSEVLLVDADLRKPMLPRYFDISKYAAGLTNLVVDEEGELESLVQKTAFANLFVLPSGPVPPYPAELLSSVKMSNLVDYLAGQYEYIIFDSPPVVAVTDAAILSRLVDGTIMVLDHGRVTRDEAVLAREHLKKVGANLIGAVLNEVPARDGYYSYYQYYAQDSDSQNKKPKKKRRIGRSLEE